jgi:diadenylate cyclase
MAPFGWADAVEVLILSWLFYRFLLLIQRTRAAQLVKGIGVLLLFWVVSYALKLPTLTWVLEKIMTMFVIALPILFQPELRRGLEHLGRGEFLSNALGAPKGTEDQVDILVQVTNDLAHRQIGAILAIEQTTGLEEYVETGTHLDAVISEEILLAIFNVLSPLHDGACIIRNGRVEAAGCTLPLSDSLELSKKYATRHRAALGLSEESDAIVLVVSEERGEISLCHLGLFIANLEPKALRHELSLRLNESPAKKSAPKP